jgi:hypothetical protein
MDDSIKVARWFIDFIANLIVCFAEKHFLDDHGKLSMEEIEIGEAPVLDDVKMPFFVKSP